MKLIITLSANQIELVNASVIEKLYNLILNGLSLDSELQGRIRVAASYEDVVQILRTRFPNLQIDVDSYYICFADINVLNVLRNAGLGNTIGITTSEAENFNIDDTFKNNTDITSFDEFNNFIKNNTTANYSFEGCTNLQRINLDDCIKFSNGSFKNCSNLEYFSKNNPRLGVLYLRGVGGSSTFEECDKITTVEYEDNVLSFGTSDFFRNCTGLTTVVAGTGIVSSGNRTFDGCTNITTVIVPTIEQWISMQFYDSSYPSTSPMGGSANAHLYIGDLQHECTLYEYENGTTNIKHYAFAGCVGLTSVTIPTSVTSIGKGAFYKCKNLVINDLNLPNLQSIDQYGAFLQVKIQRVSNLGNITSLPSDVFYDCSTLSEIHIPATVLNIGEDALRNVADNYSIYITDLSKWLSCNKNLAWTNTDNYLYLNSALVTSITLDNSVTAIPDGMLRLCQNLLTVTLPNTITSIGNYAFYGCANITSTMAIPTGVKNIGIFAFSNCGITAITGLNQQMTVGRNAFENSGLLSFPDITGWTEIPPRCFAGCKYLTGDINIPSTVTAIGGNNLTGDTLPFAGCGALSAGINNINIAEGCTVIQRRAFQECKIIGQVTIPSTVSEIKQDFALRLSGRPTIKFKGLTPPNFGIVYLGNFSKVYIPLGSRSAYEDALSSQNDYNSIVFEEYVP